MSQTSHTLLRGVHLLEGPGRPHRQADVRFADGRILTIDEEATQDTGIRELDGRGLWLGPALVDPHSVLEDPISGRAESLSSLAAAAASGGYGTVALLPWATPWRDRPETLQLAWPEPLSLRLWGSFSLGGAETDLAEHEQQLRTGAVGLAGGPALPAHALLERGLRLGEMGDRPLLLAPRDPSLSQQGFVRQRVEALRAGWPVDPPISETLPLETLLLLASGISGSGLRLMNLSTQEAVARLSGQPTPPRTSVCWWHLLADSGNLDPAAEGWRIEPSLGGPQDREALISALERGLINAIAVHHQALDAEETLLTPEQRRPGVAGHGLAGGVLAALWAELVQRRRWDPALLWDRLCWGPSRFLGLEPEILKPGCRRWILFSPQAPIHMAAQGSLAANHPHPPGGAEGAIVANGLIGEKGWWAPELPSR